MPNAYFYPNALAANDVGNASLTPPTTIAPGVTLGGSALPSPQAGTLSNDLTGAGSLTSLTQLLNSLGVAGQTTANAARIPNATGLETQSSAAIGSELSGALPPDVVNLIQQQGAERGVATGSPGSPNAEASTLQALGLTSLGQIQTGEQNLSAADARNPVAPVASPSSILSIINSLNQSPGQTITSQRGYGASSGGAGASSLNPANPAAAPAATTPAATTPAGIDPALYAALFGPDAATGTAGSLSANPAAGLTAYSTTASPTDPGFDPTLYGE
jgi:hypothetical protein